jgi:hypothetical protein
VATVLRTSPLASVPDHPGTPDNSKQSLENTLWFLRQRVTANLDIARSRFLVKRFGNASVLRVNENASLREEWVTFVRGNLLEMRRVCINAVLEIDDSPLAVCLGP